MIKYISFLLLTMLLSSCMNQYEREMEGTYKIEAYKDVSGNFNERYFELKLNGNRTFEFHANKEGKKVYGTWSAYDADDWILIEFVFSDKFSSQGMVGHYKDGLVNFKIDNGAEFFDKDLQETSFIKTE